MPFLVSDSFLKSAYELPKEIAPKVWKALHLFSRNRDHPSLHTEKLSAAHVSIRVDLQYRAILQDGEGTSTLLFVGPHDEAYRVAGRMAPVLNNLAPTARVSAAPVGVEQVKDLVQTKKYLPLAVALLGQTIHSVQFTFPKIESIIGQPLPPAARRYRAWWGNARRGHVQASAWLSVGWKVGTVDLSSETVTFERISRSL